MILSGKIYNGILLQNQLYDNIDDHTLRYFNYKIGYRNIPGFVYADLDNINNQIIVYILKSRSNISISMHNYIGDISLYLDQVKDCSITKKSYHITYRYFKHVKT